MQKGKVAFMSYEANDGSTIVYVPDAIRQQGTTITNDTEQLTTDTKTFWQNFQQSYQKMPPSVQNNLKSFEDALQPHLSKLLANRITIGHLLSHAASEMEQQDAQTQYSFYENMPLDSLTKE
jgi:hypothetical protein